MTQQAELVNKINTNTEDAAADLEAANQELTALHETVSYKRQLMLKIFFILMIFVTFYIIFVLWLN